MSISHLFSRARSGQPCSPISPAPDRTATDAATSCSRSSGPSFPSRTPERPSTSPCTCSARSSGKPRSRGGVGRNWVWIEHSYRATPWRSRTRCHGATEVRLSSFTAASFSRRFTCPAAAASSAGSMRNVSITDAGPSMRPSARRLRRRGRETAPEGSDGCDGRSNGAPTTRRCWNAWCTHSRITETTPAPLTSSSDSPFGSEGTSVSRSPRKPARCFRGRSKGLRRVRRSPRHRRSLPSGRPTGRPSTRPTSHLFRRPIRRQLTSRQPASWRPRSRPCAPRVGGVCFAGQPASRSREVFSGSRCSPGCGPRSRQVWRTPRRGGCWSPLSRTVPDRRRSIRWDESPPTGSREDCFAPDSWRSCRSRRRARRIAPGRAPTGRRHISPSRALFTATTASW